MEVHSLLQQFLSLVEQNYKIYNKKILAIIHILEEWRYFLKDTVYLVQIWMDYKNLEYFMTIRKLNCRQAQWFFYLAHFDFIFYYYLGQSMDKLDTLFQRPNHSNRSLDNKNIVLLCPKVLAIWVWKE